MCWIDDELQKAHSNYQWTTMVVMRQQYIAALEALKSARKSLAVSATSCAEDRQLVLAALRKIDGIGM